MPVSTTLPHQAVRNDFLDRAADRIGDTAQAEREQVFFVDVDHLSSAIDGDGAFAKLFELLKQRLHGTGADDVGIADDGFAIQTWRDNGPQSVLVSYQTAGEIT